MRLIIGFITVAVVAAMVLTIALLNPPGGEPAAPAPAPSADPTVSDSPTPEPSPTPTPSPTPEAEPRTEAAVSIDPAATQAAMDVLAEGGTAADAAVATAAVLSVVEPYYSNVIAGETALLWYDGETEAVSSLQGVGYVGEDWEQGAYRSRGAQAFGLHQALVPGSWDAWMTLLAEQGELDLEVVLAPAIELAEDGFPASGRLAQMAADYNAAGGMNAAAQQIYAGIGTGDTVVQSDYAETLQRLADAATDAGGREDGLEAARELVYTGELGEEIVSATQDGGGSFTTEDMARYEAVAADPITLAWDDEITVHQTPPGTQGLVMLEALNTLRDADLAGAEEADAWHLQMEALKLALADREEFLGDPDFNDVPVADLLDPDYGRNQLARIDLGSTLSAPVSPGLDNTTTFQVVDAEGNAAAVTSSTGFQFTQAGSTGIMMNNRMRYMTDSDPGSPNSIEVGKRVRYTGNPWMATTPDGLWLLGGNIGGDTQAQVQTQHFLNVVELGMSVGDAIAAPRFVTQSQPNSVVPHGNPGTVRIDADTPADVQASLRQRGHQLQPTSGAGPFGTGSMIEIDDDGQTVRIGTDPRAPSTEAQTREP